MITTYERGKADGKLEGKLEDRRETALLLLGAKFGAISSEAQQRVAELTPEQLRQLLVSLLKASSLEELHLED
jgi:predicted transposase YdaD